MSQTTGAASAVSGAITGHPSERTIPSWLWPTFVVLWLVWAALLLGGILFGELHDDQTRHGPTWSRMASSMVLAGAGWIGAIALARYAAARYATLIAVGMTLGLLGDLFNAGWMRSVSQLDTLGGMISFGLGHIAYIAACLNLGRRAGLTCKSTLRYSLIGWELFAIAGWFVVVWMGMKNLPLRLPALPYCMLLAGTAGFTTALGLQSKKLIGLALGGALFLISDLILAFPLFRDSFYLSGDAVWLTYGPGQMLIVYSIPAAARLCSRGVS